MDDDGEVDPHQLKVDKITAMISSAEEDGDEDTAVLLRTRLEDVKKETAQPKEVKTELQQAMERRVITTD